LNILLRLSSGAAISTIVVWASGSLKSASNASSARVAASLSRLGQQTIGLKDDDQTPWRHHGQRVSSGHQRGHHGDQTVSRRHISGMMRSTLKARRPSSISVRIRG
jgi:hypothetical protein